ncbi:hypothetical protein Tsubulata_051478, partial [Turnera subulata]
MNMEEDDQWEEDLVIWWWWNNQNRRNREMEMEIFGALYHMKIGRYANKRALYDRVSTNLQSRKEAIDK